MNNFKSIPFEFEGKSYEIRVVSDGTTIIVRAFLNGHPANGYSYSVDLPTAVDITRQLRIDPVQNLIETAIRDVKEKLWERYLEAIQLHNEEHG